ncbi:hypothetical protein AbauAttikon1_0002 [Acinetobacter phage Abau_Attikon1]
MDNEYAKFFFNRKVDVYQLECIELSHPSFMNTYRIVRNDDRGVYVQHKDRVNAQLEVVQNQPNLTADIALIKDWEV